MPTPCEPHHTAGRRPVPPVHVRQEYGTGDRDPATGVRGAGHTRRRGTLLTPGEGRRLLLRPLHGPGAAPLSCAEPTAEGKGTPPFGPRTAGRPVRLPAVRGPWPCDSLGSFTEDGGRIITA
ncbi:hypothetical protein GCM10015536_65580 [Streptomyces griseomycini]|nr:hypothetical protein GCM10015536_65580 [Streptomyces griseomycini]